MILQMGKNKIQMSDSWAEIWLRIIFDKVAEQWKNNFKKANVKQLRNKYPPW